MMGGVANLVFMAGDAILVLFVQDKLGLDSAGFGLLLTAFALGGLPGSLLAARISSRLPAGVVLIGGLLLWAVLYLVFGLASRPWVAAAVMVMMGVVFAFWEVVTVSLRQAIVPDQLIGRVLSAYRLLGYGAIPLGAVLGGVLGRTFGLRAPFVLGAVVLAAMALLAAPVSTPARSRRPGRRPNPNGWPNPPVAETASRVSRAAVKEPVSPIRAATSPGSQVNSAQSGPAGGGAPAPDHRGWMSLCRWAGGGQAGRRVWHDPTHRRPREGGVARCQGRSGSGLWW